MSATIWNGLGHLLVALLLVYLFAVAAKQALRGRGEARSIGVAAFLLILPAVALIHWCGGWDFSPDSAFSNPSRWWVVRVGGEGDQPGRPLNLVTVVFLASLIYVFVTALVAAVASWHNRSHGGHIQALHRGLVKWLAVSAGLLLYLHAVGVSLTPLLVGMGAASIVVGLALQEPLSSLFAGLALDMEGTLRHGDWIRVEGEGATVGRVIDKGWRSTRLLTPQREMVTLPNRVLGGQKIINYHRPDSRHAHKLYVSASYNDPPIKVKEVLRTILLREPGIMADPSPDVRTDAYGDSAINYEMAFFIDDYAQNENVKDEVMTRVWYAFQENGIEIPFPIRTVHVKNRDQLADEQKAIQEAAGDIAGFLRGVPSLQKHLGQKDFEFLAANAFQSLCPPGEPVIRKGMMGDAVFFVRDGWCEALLPGGGRRRLDVGDYFGEMALLRAGPRRADVLAGDAGATVVRVDRECMLRLFGYYPVLRQEFVHTEDARRGEWAVDQGAQAQAAESFAVWFRRAARNFRPW